MVALSCLLLQGPASVVAETAGVRRDSFQHAVYLYYLSPCILILAEGAIVLSVTLSGGVLFAS